MGTSLIDAHVSLPSEMAKDVVFDHIAHHLLAKKIISPEDYRKIKTKLTDPEQMNVLFDILSKKDSDTLNTFVDILDNDYQWIAEKLRRNFDVLKVQLQKESRLQTGITTEMIKLVQKNYRAADKWTAIAHSLGLTRHIMDIRIKVNMFGEPNSMCVVYLLQEWLGISSRDATLGRLIQVLREQEFNDIADELEEKFP